MASELQICFCPLWRQDIHPGTWRGFLLLMMSDVEFATLFSSHQPFIRWWHLSSLELVGLYLPFDKILSLLRVSSLRSDELVKVLLDDGRGISSHSLAYNLLQIAFLR